MTKIAAELDRAWIVFGVVYGPGSVMLPIEAARILAKRGVIAAGSLPKPELESPAPPVEGTAQDAPPAGNGQPQAGDESASVGAAPPTAATETAAEQDSATAEPETPSATEDPAATDAKATTGKATRRGSARKAATPDEKG